MIVADTNLIAYLLLEGEHTALAERVLDRDAHWIAPLLWRSELRNVLILSVRQKLCSFEQALRLMELAEILMRGRELTLDSTLVLEIARRSGCAAYDCEFVALAARKKAPLVTFDRKVLRAFQDIAIEPRRFLADDSLGPVTP